jgi:multidrug efflux pump subunit AcrA (membrane-fusion protein)
MLARTKLRIILPFLVLLVSGAIYFSLVNSKTERQRPTLSEKIWQVEVITAQIQALSPSITLYGRIESPELLKAAAPGGGIVKDVFVRNGSRVQQGDRLVTLDQRDFEAALLQAEADLRDIENQIAELKVRHQTNLLSLETERNLLELAAAEVQRLVQLKQQQLSAETALNAARSELGRQQLAVNSRALEVDSYPARLQILMARHDRGKAQLDQARLAMSRSDLRAPFDAIVSEVAVSAGDRVSLGQLLISLFPVRALEIRAHLPLNYIDSVQRALAVGEALDAGVASRSDLGRFPIVRLAGEAEATGIDIYFAIDSIDTQLRPGELLPLNLSLPAENDVYAVPHQAIYGNSRIYVVADDRLQAIDVTSVGQTRDASGNVQVLIRSDDIRDGDLAANLLMVMMLLSGVIALDKLNVQFFPNFELDQISVSTIWSGASSEDIESGLTIPLEQRLRSIDNLKEMTSTSATGTSGITLEFEENADIGFALDEVKKQIDNFNNFPEDAEETQVAQLVRYESVARILISGPDQIDELRRLARQFERELIDAGIDKVDIAGLPTQQLQIEIGAEQMQRLGVGLDELARRIDLESQDLPAGLIGEEDGAREIRSQNQRRTPQDFASLAIVSEADKRIHLGDIAEVRSGYLPGSPTISLDGKKAVVLTLRRNESGDSLEAAEILENWLQKTRVQLPPSIKVQVFNERWQLIKDRILLLVKNGAGGLVLVLLILYLFLSARVAFWVAVGIPVSFMATLAVLHLVGGSINMISLFALIMALGIIVDDAIVVGEDAQAHFDMGEDPLMASEGGARR